MKPVLHIVAVAAWLAPLWASQAAVAAAETPQLVAAVDPASLVMQPPVGVLTPESSGMPSPPQTGHGNPPLPGSVSAPYAGQRIAELEAAAQRGDTKAAIELATKYAHAEGVPRDQSKANQLLCGAAKYGSAEGLFQLGWAYANGRGVTRSETTASALFRRAADRGHDHAAKLLAVVPESADAKLPDCAVPAALPVAVLPPAPPGLVADLPEPQVPMAPKEIMQLVNKLAPQYEIDANLALAVIYAESAFNPQALSHANAQGLMQLIPETAERFGVKNPYKPDENIKGGLAYLRWLLAYFQGDVPLALAGYNAGEGAVDKHRGIPPYNETRDYVKKITNMYRRLTHPYNSSIVSPSPVISQLKRMM